MWKQQGAMDDAPSFRRTRRPRASMWYQSEVVARVLLLLLSSFTRFGQGVLSAFWGGGRHSRAERPLGNETGHTGYQSRSKAGPSVSA